jgi:hypothetical protein
MSHPIQTYDDHEIEADPMCDHTEIIKQEELKPQDLPENVDKTFLVEQDLHDLGVIVSRLSLRGVDKKIISDILVNNLNHQSLQEICSHLDSFLRSAKY